MKRVLAIVLVIFLMVSLVGCKRHNAYTDPPQRKIWEPSESSTMWEETTEAPPDVAWQSHSMTWTNWGGYTFRATIKVTPWLFWTDPRAEGVWKQIDGGFEKLPKRLSDWYLGEHNGAIVTMVSERRDLFKFSSPSRVIDFYYLMGTIEVENITEDRDISAKNKQTERIYLSPGGEEPCEWAEMPFETPFITKISYNAVERVQQDSVLIVDAEMRANNWGPVPFIMACAENFSPKFPDGESHEWIEKKLVYDITGVDEELVAIPLEKDIVG